MATSWVQRGNLKGPKGDTGATGAQGVSITGATVNGSGDLIVSLSSGGDVNAGRVKGADGVGVDFGGSVATPGDLPGTGNEPGDARYVRSDGHLYVWERAQDRPEGVDGWTDVGQIKGDTGATGPKGTDGAAGRGITAASVNASGHLILTFSDTGPADIGLVKGSDGATGAQGPAGVDGTTVKVYSTTPPDPGPLRVGSIAIGANGDLLEAI